MKNIATAQAVTLRSNTDRTKLRITARGRRALLAVLAVPAVALGVFGVAHATSAEAGSQVANVTFETVTVQPGDTLWGIATEIAPHDDPRDVIIELQKLNDISGAVQAGVTLDIPLQYTD